MKTLALAETLLNYYKEHEEDFNYDLEELDSWNGYLGDERAEPMEYLDEIYQGTWPTEILMRAYFGHDDDTWHEENGEKVYGEFNPNRDYFYFNAYGNLVSTDYKDYSSFLDEYFVQEIIDNECHLDLSDGAQEIIDSYEDEDERNEEELLCY